MKDSVRIKILGREYSLRSQQTPEQVQRVANFVEERLAEMAKARAVDTRDLTVLTLLNLAGEHLLLLEENARQQQQLDKRLEQLILQLDQNDSGC
ncbi:MAG TPA: cell division protein ZapA [Malonomonas sp.]